MRLAAPVVPLGMGIVWPVKLLVVPVAPLRAPVVGSLAV
jgi:hypothetical protein